MHVEVYHQQGMFMDCKPSWQVFAYWADGEGKLNESYSLYCGRYYLRSWEEANCAMFDLAMLLCWLGTPNNPQTPR